MIKIAAALRHWRQETGMSLSDISEASFHVLIRQAIRGQDLDGNSLHDGSGDSTSQDESYAAPSRSSIKMRGAVSFQPRHSAWASSSSSHSPGANLLLGSRAARSSLGGYQAPQKWLSPHLGSGDSALDDRQMALDSFVSGITQLINQKLEERFDSSSL